MSSQKVEIAKNFSCHAFNADKSLVALSPNNEDVEIYSTNGKPELMSSWGTRDEKQKIVPDFLLKEHGGFVSAIDWHSNNMIVTCGHDRNAYVWIYNAPSKEWKQTLVILRINRAATSVRWSPSGKKFAVTSGAKCVPVCHYEESSDWYISKMIKKHKSTVLCLAWSPCSKFLITGCTDFKCRIFSACAWEDETETSQLQWESQNNFGECLVEFDNAKAWVQGVAWSPNSFQVVFTGHGSTSHFVDLDATDAKKSVENVQTVYSKFLPNLTCDYLTDEKVIMAGFDRNPQLYEKKDGNWEFSKKLDDETDEKKSKAQSSIGQNRQMFQSMAKQGQKSDKVKTAIRTFHKNTILGVQLLSPSSFSTCGVDGRILIWNI